MTPPDSGPKKRTPEEWRKLADDERRGTEQGMAFLDAVERDGCMAKVKPDSGERCSVPDCIRGKGHEPPHKTLVVNDSGEREVPNRTACIGWPTIRRVAAEGGVHFASNEVSLVAADDLFHADIGAVLSQDLTQRILAALEDVADADMMTWRRTTTEQLEALVAELRALVTK